MSKQDHPIDVSTFQVAGRNRFVDVRGFVVGPNGSAPQTCVNIRSS